MPALILIAASEPGGDVTDRFTFYHPHPLVVTPALVLVYLTVTRPPPVPHLPPSDYAVEERPSEMVLMQQLEEGGPDPLVFVLNANLLAMVKLVNCEFLRPQRTSASPRPLLTSV